MVALTALLVLAAAVIIPSQAADTGGSCGENLAWTLQNGTLIISGTGEMTDFGEDATYTPLTPWYQNWREISAVVVEEGVTSLGNFAFSKLWNVSSLTLPKSLTRVGTSALNSLSKLTGDLVLSENVQEIGDLALAGCGFSRVTVPNPNAAFDFKAVGYDWDNSIGDWGVKSGFTLCGLTGGSAEAYARENGIVFESTGELPPPAPKEPVLRHDGTLLTTTEAVDEMTWGVNLCSLFMTNPNIDGSTMGYCTTAPFGLGVWTEGNGFEWLTYNDFHTGTFAAKTTIRSCPTNENTLLRIGMMSAVQGQKITLTFQNSKLTKADGTVVRLPSMDRTYTVTAESEPDLNGWCTGFIDLGNSVPTSNSSFRNATLSTTITVVQAKFASDTDKVQALYQMNQGRMNQEELTEVYLDQGCNVFRLPVTWTPFVDDDTFKIDEAWLEAVKTEVDYILSRGAYCILNTHSDYLNFSFVGDHWEDQWMETQYQEYVDARFTAIWTQIAEYFKDYPQQLIFEPFNEPTMNWYAGVDFENWQIRQAARINDMNQLFVNTVRSTGGSNTTRFLCLPTAYYCTHDFLDNLKLPDDPYLMVQLHSYSEMEDNTGNIPAAQFDYKKETDVMFTDVAAFQQQHPDVPIIIGEVGVTRANDVYAAARTAYFYEQAEQYGVPCLWWEDGYGSGDNSFSMYVINERRWDRSDILEAIQAAIKEPVQLTFTVNDQNFYWTGTLEEACTVVAAVYQKNGQFLGCSTWDCDLSEKTGQLALTVPEDLADCDIRVLFAGDGTYAPIRAAISRSGT